MTRPASQNEFVYFIDPDLKAVVNLAIKLQMPLLVTGEPGTGKTRLARYVAEHMMGGQADLITFNAKTTSKARDLLYFYNTLSHFRDSRDGRDANPMAYISFQGLGQAIIASDHKPQVVLVDEIDKAPRDFPNDVLFEFENLAFEVIEASADHVREHAQQHKWDHLVDEQGVIRAPQHKPKPVLILTSNSEKNLPDAFLRRCVYYHIPFPTRDRLLEILQKNVKLSEAFQTQLLDQAVDHFLAIRQLVQQKKPATAELLSWISVIEEAGIDPQKGLDSDDETIRQVLKDSYSLLTKTREDRNRLLSEMNLS